MRHPREADDRQMTKTRWMTRYRVGVASCAFSSCDRAFLKLDPSLPPALVMSSSNPKVNHFDLTPWHLSGPIVWSLNRSTVPRSVAGSVDSVLNRILRHLVQQRIFAGPRYPSQARQAG